MYVCVFSPFFLEEDEEREEGVWAADVEDGAVGVVVGGEGRVSQEQVLQKGEGLCV